MNAAPWLIALALAWCAQEKSLDVDATFSSKGHAPFTYPPDRGAKWPVVRPYRVQVWSETDGETTPILDTVLLGPVAR